MWYSLLDLVEPEEGERAMSDCKTLPKACSELPWNVLNVLGMFVQYMRAVNFRYIILLLHRD